MYFYFIISGFFNAITSTLLGFLVYKKNKHSKANKLFALLCFSFAAWSYPYTMWPLAETKEAALFWFQLLHFGAIFIPITYFHFVLIWFGSQIKKKRQLIIGYSLAIFFCFFVFSPLFIADMTPKFSMKWWAEPGIMYHFYLLYFFFFYIYASILLFLGYLKSEGIKRSQAKFVLIGLVVAIAGGSTNYFLWYDINIPPYGNILASMHVILGAYAIVRHRLMDIKFVLRKSAVYFASLSTIIIVAVVMRYVCIRFFTDLTAWFYILILTASVSIFPPIKDYYYHLANKYFFTSIYSGQKVIASLSGKLRSTLKVEMIHRYLSKTFIDSFHAESVGILIYDKKAKNYLLDFNKSFNFGKRKKIKFSNNFFSKFIKHNKPIVVEEVKHFSYKKYKNTIDLLTDLNIAIIVPLNVKDKAVGLIILGRKESGDIYNDKDIGVLKVIGAQAAIAIENALLYEETENFAIKLKKEVQKATADLKIANKELKKLDAAKSDFISIASHQLRTPLTVIKGYISMMIEGNFGKLTGEELSSLKKVYTSNERLIQLVENLLNISRIESGKLQFNFSQVRLEEVVESVFEELADNARKKGLSFKFEEPGQALPKINIDGEKIRYVILNLVDNAIKYTKEGSVTISLKLESKDIYFCVSDTGIGIKKEDSSILFKRFSRGKGISVIHPEGTGIGLYVAKMMIKAHHGKIWAESEGRNKGSRFCFTIPISHNA